MHPMLVNPEENFFTPADVSVLLTCLGTVGKTKVNKVYEGAYGSENFIK